jgi:hypothetical protein
MAPEDGDPMLLFADIGNLENNHPCKKCIEEEYEDTITELQTNIGAFFQFLEFEMNEAGNKMIWQKQIRAS